MVVVVLDASNDLEDEDKEILEYTKDKERIIVYNKADKVNHKQEELYISALNKEIDQLKEEIYKRLGLSNQDFVTPSLVNDRQIGLLEQMKISLIKAKEDSKEVLNIIDDYPLLVNLLNNSINLD